MREREREQNIGASFLYDCQKNIIIDFTEEKANRDIEPPSCISIFFSASSFLFYCRWTRVISYV